MQDFTVDKARIMELMKDFPLKEEEEYKDMYKEIYNEEIKEIRKSLKDLENDIFDDKDFNKKVSLIKKKRDELYDEIDNKLRKRIKKTANMIASKNRFKKYMDNKIDNYMFDYKRKRDLLNKEWKKAKRIPLERNEFYDKYGKKLEFKMKPRLWKPIDYADFEDRSNKKEIFEKLDYNENLYNAYLNYDLDYIKENNNSLYNDLVN